MKNILIISGHPNLEQSLANRTIIEEVKKQLPSVEISQLDTLYPDFKINVEAEQEKLKKQIPSYGNSLYIGTLYLPF